jgi:malate/lactate dehydrogenase
VKKVAVWGNASSTMYYDTRKTTINGIPILALVEESWVKEEFAVRAK